MKKTIINVPDYVHYISDWKEFLLPNGHSIINKTVCGCGFTEFCLRNDEDIILCSPRVSLLENKAEQNLQCFMVKPFPKLTNKKKEDLGITDKESLSKYNISLLKNDLNNYFQKRSIDRINSLGKDGSLKILVTYDSLSLLLKSLKTMVDINRFKIVVDEFQLIFNDSRFKASTELNFVSYLQDCPNVLYLSATPMLEEYLEKLEEFKELPYYVFNWGNRVIKPNITRIKTTNLEQSALEIIKLYRDGNTESSINYKGETIKSNEVVFYCNNVGMITSIIKKAKLLSDEVNIIISQSNEENKLKLSRCGRGFKFGRSPLPGKPHKMFTFCTSTAYCGMDFYSTNAQTVVLSNCNLETLAVDISLDLPQIIGRQRLPENPFRFSILFFYTTIIKEFTRDDLENLLVKKREKTESCLRVFENTSRNVDRNNIIIDRKELIRFKQYSDDYTGVNEKTGKLCFNRLVELSEIRAWEVQQLNYKDDISVLGNLEKMNPNGDIINKKSKINDIISSPIFEDRMKLVCEEYKKGNVEIFNYISSEYKEYIDILGIDEIEKSSYRKFRLDEKISKIQEKNNLILSDEIYREFSENNKYTLQEIKGKIKEIYDKLNFLSLSPKASIIKNYFEVKRIRIQLEKNKYNEGYELLSKKGGIE